jgi:putative DNA primase/helicase
VSAVHEVTVEARCRVIWPQEATESKPLRQVIRGVLAADSLVLMMGDSGTGKSTTAINMGCAVATGNAWRGYSCDRGLVLHLAGEGLHGVRQRETAEIREGRGTLGMPYGIIPQTVDLAQPGDVAELLELIAAAESEVGEKLALFIIDTLARCFGIDENDGAQMRQAIAACDEIRAATGAAILLIHHVGKDASKGARGHSSLRAAVDTELLVEGRENPRTITVTKQRDLPTVDPMAFDLEAVTIGTDPVTFENITACIVRHSTTPPPRKAPTGKQQATLLAELERRYAKGEIAWSDRDIRAIGRELGMHKNTARSAALALHTARYLSPSVGGCTLTQAPEATP